MNNEGSDEFGWRESVYILLDCSASMGTETLAEIQEQIRVLSMYFLSDPTIIESLRTSLITFDSHVRQVFPLTSILSDSITSKLEIPFIAQGTSSLGAALLFLDETINREVKKTKQNSKGDYVPYTFIITDAQPTDQWQESLTYFVKRNHRPFFVIPFHIEETNSIALKIYYSSLFVTERNRDKFPPNETCTKRSGLDFFWYEDELNDLDLSYFVFNYVKAIVTSKYLS
jgi:uncharacterized protein YegL